MDMRSCKDACNALIDDRLLSSDMCNIEKSRLDTYGLSWLHHIPKVYHDI